MFASIFKSARIFSQVLPTVENLIPFRSKYTYTRKKICGTWQKKSDSHGRTKKKFQRSVEENNAKPVQEWWDWDGIGRYKSRRHGYPVNLMLRDVQKRRSFEKHNEERILINAVWKNDFLPKEIRDFAYSDIQKHPRDSTVLRINRRCSVTGRARGVFHQFRVSRFVFRNEADYNKISGAQRAHWLTGVDLKP